MFRTLQPPCDQEVENRVADGPSHVESGSCQPDRLSDKIAQARAVPSPGTVSRGSHRRQDYATIKSPLVTVGSQREICGGIGNRRLLGSLMDRYGRDLYRLVLLLQIVHALPIAMVGRNVQAQGLDQ